MTHLYIEQATDKTEEVNSSIISKLYELAISGNLDASSDLKGRLHSSVARDVLVTYLNEHFTDLHISADALYLSFVDPEVERVLAAKYGDGTGVTNINMAGITEINSYTGFSSNTAITSFSELSNFNNIVRLGTWAFTGCTNLTTIDLTNILYMGGEALKASGISGIVNLTNIVSIGDSTRSRSFCSCSNITLVNIGSNFNNDTTNMYGCFEDCTGLTKVTGLSNLTSIEGRTFYNCNALSSVDIDWNKITNVGEWAFMRCYSLLFGELDLSGVTTISQEAFRECYGITKLLLGNNTTISGYSAFYECTGITEVTGLSGITTIPSWTFDGCTSLSSVDIDWSKITSIGTCALSKCPIGTGLTIELNLTNQSDQFGGALERTKFDKIIVHCNWSGSGDTNHPQFNNLPYTTYIDASDCILHTAFGYSMSTVYGDNSLVTVIYPPSVSQICCGLSGFRNALGTFKYMIILNTTPPDINVDDNNPFSLQFSSNSILHIYVPDSAVSDYLADSKWSQLGGDNGTVTILLRLHGLSELPAGVWTTGLASQYLTPAQLITT